MPRIARSGDAVAGRHLGGHVVRHPGRDAGRHPGRDAGRHLGGQAGIIGVRRHRAAATGSARSGRRRARRIAVLTLRVSLTVAVLGALTVWAVLPRDPSSPVGAGFDRGTPADIVTVSVPVDRQPPTGRSTDRPGRPPGSASVIAPPPAGPGATGGGDPACRVGYAISLTPADAFTVVLVIADTGEAPVQGWTLRWAFPASRRILYGWNAMVSNGPDGAVATDLPTDRTIPAGGTVTIGFTAARGDRVPTLTGFTLNGNVCGAEPVVVATGPAQPSSGSGAGCGTCAGSSVRTPRAGRAELPAGNCPHDGVCRTEGGERDGRGPAGGTAALGGRWRNLGGAAPGRRPGRPRPADLRRG